MAKRASKQGLIQFRNDLGLLKQRYSNNEIAARLGINPANLSSYATGAKNPSQATIDNFYKEFGEEIKNMDYQHSPDDEQQSFAADSQDSSKYQRTNSADHQYGNGRETHDHRDDHIQTLKKMNDHLIAANRTSERHTGDALAIAADAVRTTADEVKNTTRLTITNQRLVGFVLSRQSIRRKRRPGGNPSADASRSPDAT
ncbi:MAG TPA: helix-turn-helix transcriptional regulator [Puia sp.]|nr:helix-turn-helix transcriptional regulator [Puia sp.]